MSRKQVLYSSLFAACLMLVTLGSCALYRIIPKTITLLASSQSTATGIEIRNTDEITLVASGMIKINPDLPDIPPEGSSDLGTPYELDPSGAISYPMPGELTGAVIGRIGASGDAFLIGSSLTLTAETSGELYLLINDNYWENNSGSFEVTVIFDNESLF